MPKKKIAFVIGSLSSGGAERVVSNLANELIDKFEIVIITFVESTPFYNLDNRIKVIACTQSIEKSSSAFQALKLNYFLTTKIIQILKIEHVNIVIAFITSANILSTIASIIHRIPCIISERNNPLIEDVPRFWRILRRFIYPLADSIVLQTQGIKKIYENKIKINKITILPNPIASELSNQRDYNIKKENLIITVGRLDKNKGHDDIIKVFGSIDTQNWKLLIIGEGSEKQELITLINILNLNDKVKIVSKVKNINDYYNKASIFVSASKTEGFPNALLEAMHFGLPSISYDCDFGPSDLIDDGVNGYLVPVNNVSILRERLSQLISNENLRRKFSHKSKCSTENYLSEKVITQWEELINSVL